MLHKKIIDKIEFEISEIEKMLYSYDSLIELCKKEEPNLIEKTAAASVLHSFYTGVENITTLIIKDFDNVMPTGKNWYKSALLSIADSTDKRSSIISEKSLTVLLDYLSFRHFYRHSYSFHLDWDQMGKLIQTINDVWITFKTEINVFLDWLKSTE